MSPPGTVCDADPFGVFGAVPVVSDPGTGALLARALAAPVGPVRLALLAHVDGRLLNGADRVDHMVSWQQCVSWATAHSELAVALVAGPPVDMPAIRGSSKPTGNIAEDERCATVGAALHITPNSAKTRLEAARSAADELAPVTTGVLRGQWTRLHLWYAESAIDGHAKELSRVAVRNVCAMRGCEEWTPRRLGQRIRKELVRLDSEAISKRIRRRRHQRSAHLDPTDDLHGAITVDASWETVAWAFGVFRRWAEHERDRLRRIRKHDPTARFCCPQAMARLLIHTAGATSGGAGISDGDACDGIGPDDDCPFCGQPDAGIPDVAALTADAVVAAAGLLAQQVGDPAQEVGPRRGKAWGTAVIVTDVPTAFHLADNPGHVPGYGDVPADIARDLLAQSQVWRRFMIDGSGALLDTGAHTYRPSDKLREHVRARDWTCTFPGCNRPSAQADLDHITNFDGSNTKESNLHALCRTHHRLKTYGGWTPHRQPDGSTVWIAPDGHTYTNTNDTPWADFARARDSVDVGHHRSREVVGGSVAGDGSTRRSTARDAWLDDPRATPPPAEHVIGPRIATYWQTAPYAPAERALAHLVAGHLTPPGRAP